MKIAIDLDGTITKHRKLIELAWHLREGGCNVFCLTAAAGELPPAERPAEVRRRLAKLGASWLPVECVESCDKPQWCRDHRVDLLIDDTRFEMLPGTILLHVP